MQKLIKASELKWDHKIGRMTDEVSHVHVSRMAEAVAAGAVLPPIVVTDDGTNRIADGVHRWTVHNITKGIDSEILCEVRKFASEEELFLFSVAANAAHGQVASSYETKKIILEAEARGINLNLLADAIKLPVDTMKKMIVDGTGFYKPIPGAPSERVPLKATIAKQFHGRLMDDAQYQLAKRMGGMQPGYYIKQVISILELGDINDLGPVAQEGLKTLNALLPEKLSALTAKPPKGKRGRKKSKAAKA